MDDNQGFHGENPDLYEEILVSESLDQYEGLLNYSKRTKKCPQKSTKDFSTNTPTQASHDY